ncbi:MAG TPA: TorF family putative porin [Burkholderiaceae bacterium]|nr:TorF family putative porin [Burkholderiaceae bacterium]
MKRTIVAASLAVLLAAPTLASAQAKPEPAFTLTGNAGLFSDYRFRGFTQTGYGPAFQGGFDFAHQSGFYVGNWNSNVEQALYNGASLEMDLYAGYKLSAGPVGLDFGYLHYFYPNSGALGSTKIDNGELYAGVSYGPVSAKLYYAVTKFFGLGEPPTYANVDTKGSWYLDVSGSYEVAPKLTLSAHYGYQKIENGKQLLIDDTVSDYKVGVSYDLSGWALGAAVVGTSEKDLFTTAESGFTEGGGKTGVVLSVSRTF